MEVESRKNLILLILLCLSLSVQSQHTNIPTLHIAGNSTAKNGDKLGWGSSLQNYFNRDSLRVINRARAGRSSRTFITEGWWDSISTNLQRGDYVLIEFGHNDAGLINDSLRARGSFPTLGDEMKEINNQQTGKPELVRSFGWYMSYMIEESRAKGAIPIVLSMTARNVWPDDEIERENIYCTLAKEVAEKKNVPFVDLRNIIADQYEILGPIRVRELFPIDHTHTSATGARLNAAMVVSGLLNTGLPFQSILSESGTQILPYQENRMVDAVSNWMAAAWKPGVQPASDPSLPTLYAIGNSTVRNGTKGDGSNGQWGWGAPFADYFDRSLLNVENRALGGTSSRTFRSLGLWEEVRKDLKPGDFVIMQFGHNDSSPVNDSARARGTLDGNTKDSLMIQNMLTGKAETVHSYGWYVRQFILETRARGATPVVCSLIPRNRWTGGKVQRSENSYGQWAKDAANEEGAWFIDLNTLISSHYDKMGEKRASSLYFDTGDKTHTNAAGAQLNARMVVEGIKGLDALSLSKYLLLVEAQ